MEPVCAWKSLERIFVCFWCFWMLFDPCLRNLLDVVNLFGRSFVGYLWVWAEDVLFGEAGRTFLKLENSFEVVWEVWERLSVTAFYSARLFLEEEWLSCQTCVVWLKSELWKRAATPLSCFHMVAEPQWSWGWGADAKRGCCDLWKIDTGQLRRF